MTDTSTLASGKRPRDADQPEKENIPSDNAQPGVKKRRFTTASLAARLTEKEATPPPKGPDPYRTIPPPSTEWIQLRFQLNRFQGVYRVVQVPTNYTFANLHTLIQYLFGWNGYHSHQTRVYTNVEMYKSANRKGCIKSYGQAPPMPEEWIIPNLSPELQESERYWWNVRNAEAAIYEVVAVGKNQGKYKDSRGCFSDYSWHYKAEDPELTLGDVWNLDEEKNVSKGEYSNRNIGLIYEYELGCGSSLFLSHICSYNSIFVVQVRGRFTSLSMMDFTRASVPVMVYSLKKSKAL
jgi:hypothetical protein